MTWKGLDVMIALFVNDHRYRQDKHGDYWSTGSLPAVVWQRYLAEFSQVRVCGRFDGEIDDTAGLAKASATDVEFVMLPSLSGPLKVIANRRLARRSLKEAMADVDALIIRLPSELGLLAANVATALNKPFMLEIAGSALEGYGHHGSLIAKAYAPIVHQRVKQIVRGASLVVYVTNKWLQEQYPSGNPTLPSVGDNVKAPLQACLTNAQIRLPSATVRAARTKRLQELRDGRPPVFGTIGTLRTRYKGLQFSLPAFGQVHKKLRGSTYRILGPGDPQRWAQMAAKVGAGDSVFFDGTLPSGEAVMNWLSCIDIYVQPSLTEGLPRATLEAMSQGVACIGSSAGGLPELLDPTWMHRPGDREQLTHHMRLLAGQPESVAALSEHSWSVITGLEPETIDNRRSIMLRALRNLAG